MVPHFVTRQLFCGAGKVGSETPALDPDERATSRSPSGPSSSRRWSASRPRSSGPIVNTRDEPHADPKRFRRLHVIVGDANLSEVATFLKVGTTALVLAMIEDDARPARRPALADPVRGHAPGLGRPRRCPRPLDAGRRVDGHRPRDPVGALRRRPAGTPRRRARLPGRRGGAAEAVLDRWEAVLAGLRDRPGDARRASSTGWPSASSSGLPGAPRLRRGRTPGWPALDLQYHDLRPERSLFARARHCERLVDDAAGGRRAVTEPPRGHPRLVPRAPAWPAGPTRSSPPTGIRWSSTWERTRCGASL